MIILGIDPGYAIVGYGVIEANAGKYRPISYGAILTEAGEDFNHRLCVIYDDLSEIIRRYRPQAVSIEKLFYHTRRNAARDRTEQRPYLRRYAPAGQNGGHRLRPSRKKADHGNDTPPARAFRTPETGRRGRRARACNLPRPASRRRLPTESDRRKITCSTA